MDIERRELVRLTKRAHVNRALAFRARLVLACTEAVPNTAVARRYRTSNATVGTLSRLVLARRLCRCQLQRIDLYPVESFTESSRKINAIRRLYKAAFQQESVLRVDDLFAVRVSF